MRTGHHTLRSAADAKRPGADAGRCSIGRMQPFSDVFGPRAGSDPRALADPAGGSAARHAACALVDEFSAGHRAPAFHALRANAMQARTPGAAPALDELIRAMCATVRPWRAPDGCPRLRELASLLCVEPLESADVLTDERDGMHILPDGHLLARQLDRSDARTLCGEEVRGMLRAPRGAWMSRHQARCRHCQQWLISDVIKESSPMLDERDEPAHPCPVADPALRRMERDIARDVEARLRAKPEQAAAGFDKWFEAAYSKAVRRALGSTAKSLIRDGENLEHQGRFRWALNGRYSQAPAQKQRLLDLQLPDLIELTSLTDWRTACPTLAQLTSGRAPAHLADRLCRRVAFVRL